MASFQKQVGQAQFPFINPNIPKADLSRAGQIEKGGKLLLDAYEGKVKADLEGVEENVEDVRDQQAQENIFGVLYKQGAQKEAAKQAALQEDLSLHKIIALRKQGKISAEGAKTLASKAVQEASSRMPGRAAEFRKEAAAMFGDFGPGQGILEDTRTESENYKTVLRTRQKALDMGFGYSKNNTVVFTDDHLQSFLAYQAEDAEIKMKRARLGLATEQADWNAVATGNAASAIMDSDMARISYKFASNYASGQELTPEVIQQYVVETELALQNSYNALGEYANKIRARGGFIGPSKLASIREEMKQRATEMKTLFNDSSFQELMKNKAETVNNFFAVAGASMFPRLAAARAAAGQEGVKFLIETLPKFEQLWNSEQGKLAIQANPAYRMMLEMNQRIPFMLDQFNKYKLGEPVSFGNDPLAAGIRNRAARSDTLSPDAKTQERGVNYLLEQSKLDGARVLEAYTDPNFASNATPKTIDTVTNHIVSLNTQASINLPQLMAGNERRVVLHADFTKPEPFSAVPQTDDTSISGQAGAYLDMSTDIKKAVEDMNTMYKISKNFMQRDEFREKFGNKKPEEVFSNIVTNINGKSEQFRMTAKEKASNSLAKAPFLIREAMQGNIGARGALIEQGYTLQTIDPKYRAALLEKGKTYTFTHQGYSKVGRWNGEFFDVPQEKEYGKNTKTGVEAGAVSSIK